MRVAVLAATLLLPVASWAEESPTPTITPTSLPTPTTRPPRPARSLQGLPTGLPGFGVPGEPPTQRPATEKPVGDAP